MTAENKRTATHWIAQTIEGGHAQPRNSSLAVLSTVSGNKGVAVLAITLHHDQNWHYFQVPKLITQANVRDELVLHRALQWLKYLP
jgi:hypothetical protein